MQRADEPRNRHGRPSQRGAGHGGPSVQTDMLTPQSGAAPPRSPRMNERAKNVTDKVLRELCDRYLRSAPEAMTSIVPVMLLMEEAFWAYFDEYTPEKSEEYSLLPSFEQGLLKDFTYEMLLRYPQLVELYPDAPRGGLDAERNEPNKHSTAKHFHKLLCEYKRQVPSAGAVLLSHDLEQVVLVRSAVDGALWSFPKGKCRRLNPSSSDPASLLQLESAQDAAVREVCEQTSIDISSLIARGAELVEHRITRRDRAAVVSLFVVVLPDGVADPRPQSEDSRVAAAEWHRWAKLAAASAGTGGRDAIGKYDCVVRFVRDVAPVLERLRERRRGPPPFDWQSRRQALRGRLAVVLRWPDEQQRADPPRLTAAAAERRRARRQELAAAVTECLLPGRAAGTPSLRAAAPPPAADG